MIHDIGTKECSNLAGTNVANWIIDSLLTDWINKDFCEANLCRYIALVCYVSLTYTLLCFQLSYDVEYCIFGAFKAMKGVGVWFKVLLDSPNID